MFRLISRKPITITNPEMTRFLMSLDEAVELVLYAFKNGNQGDLFIQKSQASTIQDLVIALKEMFKASNPIKIIGTRHGEKIYETLCTSEEMRKSKETANYYIVPADNRDLNYEKYFKEGSVKKNIEDYNSHNTYRLSVDEIKKKLLSLDYVKDKLKK